MKNFILYLAGIIPLTSFNSSIQFDENIKSFDIIVIKESFDSLSNSFMKLGSNESHIIKYNKGRPFYKSYDSVIFSTSRDTFDLSKGYSSSIDSIIDLFCKNNNCLKIEYQNPKLEKAFAQSGYYKKKCTKHLHDNFVVFGVKFKCRYLGKFSTKVPNYSMNQKSNEIYILTQPKYYKIIQIDSIYSINSIIVEEIKQSFK